MSVVRGALGQPRHRVGDQRQLLRYVGGHVDASHRRLCSWVVLLVMLSAALAKSEAQRCLLCSSLLVIADLFAFGINYNPTCERSKVYPRDEADDGAEAADEERRAHRADQSRSGACSRRRKTPFCRRTRRWSMGCMTCRVMIRCSPRHISRSWLRSRASIPARRRMGIWCLVRRYPRRKEKARFVLTREDLSRWTSGQPMARKLELLGVFDGVRLYSFGPPLRLFRRRNWPDAPVSGWMGLTSWSGTS